MIHPLNLFIPIRQNDDGIAKLRELERRFATDDQQKIEEAAQASNILHFLRIVNLDDKYLCVITEYDGDHLEYSEYFRKNLNDLFKYIFEMADIDVNWDEINQEIPFYHAAKKFHRPSMGRSTYGEIGPDQEPAGYLFSAYDNKSVEDIKAALG